MKTLFLLSLIFLTTTSFGLELDEIWTLDGFKDPESAVIDLKREVIYVSNVNVFGKDGNGAISRVTFDGSLVDHNWITGVHSPTGSAIFEGNLYFADFDALVIADLESGDILDRIDAPDIADKPVLNDVAISDDGDVYVSGSRSRAIYHLVDGELQVWLRDEFLLENANGLLVDDGVLVHGGKRWTVFDRKSRAVVEEALRPEDKLVDFDGIMFDQAGGYLVTTIDDPRLWRISSEGSFPVSEQPLKGIDLDLKGHYLALPRVGGKLTLYRVSPKKESGV